MIMNGISFLTKRELRQMQTKKGTAVEIAVNTTIGIIGSWLITYAVINSDLHPVEAATYISAYCTVWSIVRGYCVRRFFNSYSKVD